MNKILTLYNLEFKRIYKLYFGLLLALVGGNIVVIVANIISQINNISISYKMAKSLEILKTDIAINQLIEFTLQKMYGYTSIVLGVAVLICLLYAVAIWYIDFIGKSKVSYTLFMLPENKFNIYISKLTTVVTMIYGLMATQIITWLISVSIIGKLYGIENILKILIEKSRIIGASILIQMYPIDFLMINVIGVILAVIVIFTGVLIQLSFKKIGILLAPAYITGSIAIFMYTFVNANFTDIRLTYNVIYFTILFLVSITLSYRLLNKRVFV